VVQHKQEATKRKRIYRICLKRLLKASKKALLRPQWGEQAHKLHCTSIVQSILQQLLECGDVNQQKVMLV